MSTERDDDYDTDEYDDEAYDDEAYDDETTYDTDDSGGGAKWASAVTALLGLWLLAVPTFFWGADGADFWSDLIVGAGIVALAAYSYYESSDDDFEAGNWASAINGFLGLWVLIGAFVWELTDLLFWNDVVVGALVGILAGYAAFAGEDAPAGIGTEQRT